MGGWFTHVAGRKDGLVVTFRRTLDVGSLVGGEEELSKVEGGLGRFGVAVWERVGEWVGGWEEEEEAV